MIREISCQEAARYVYGYLDGELEPRTRAEFLQHLEACRKCLGAVEFERRVIDFIRDRGSSESPSPGLRDRVRRLFEAGAGAGNGGSVTRER
ncbi:MAG: zf-HC2 domain-containing protein [Gemmatimonadetes bacterium]|nr:zf-HC2 domain-containing protein [Gemmatimonadota bacterium]